MIACDTKAYNLIVNEEIKIRDLLIKRIDFSREEVALAKIYLSDNKEITIISMRDIIEMNFTFFEDDPRYVEDFKISRLDNGYYFSIDPDNSVSEPVSTDCNFIISRNVEIEKQ